MKIIYNKEEFRKFYHYKSEPKKLPEEYPCIVEKIFEDGGLGGGYVDHKFIYFPLTAKNIRERSIFLAGYKAGRKVGEYI